MRTRAHTVAALAAIAVLSTTLACRGRDQQSAAQPTPAPRSPRSQAQPQLIPNFPKDLGIPRDRADRFRPYQLPGELFPLPVADPELGTMSMRALLEKFGSTREALEAMQALILLGTDPSAVQRAPDVITAFAMTQDPPTGALRDGCIALFDGTSGEPVMAVSTKVLDYPSGRTVRPHLFTPAELAGAREQLARQYRLWSGALGRPAPFILVFSESYRLALLEAIVLGGSGTGLNHGIKKHGPLSVVFRVRGSDVSTARSIAADAVFFGDSPDGSDGERPSQVY